MTSFDAVAKRALVVGLAVTGEAVARQLQARGTSVTVVDDRPDASVRARADRLGLILVESPSPAQLTQLVADTDLVVPSPGVPAHHAVFALANQHRVPVWSEFELAARWSTPPLVAVTGTNGKTTVTTMVTEMLVASGKRAVSAGNTEIPLVDVLDRDVDVVVVEASSFRLQFTESFRPTVAVWLNLAQDHLDWHHSMEEYALAKAKIWAHQTGSDTAIANVEDPAVMEAAASAGGILVTFGLRRGDWHRAGGDLVGPDGVVLVAESELRRALPHDVTNALASAAAALAAGASLEGCRAVLRSFAGLPHRVTLVSDAGGVRYYDDSKATTPASVLAAVRGLASVVLICGGRNKGLDLSVLRAAVPPVRSVVAIGEAAEEVRAAFTSMVPVAVATSMDEAVAIAASRARAGDAVLLSPGCASFDWYGSYAERGDDFARAVRSLVGAGT